MEIGKIISDAYASYARYFLEQLTLQNEGGILKNYFWMLLFISAFFFLLEIMRPWRENQPRFRKDFWQDFFYMFFNFFLFSLLIFHASSTVVVTFFQDGFRNLTGIDLATSNLMYGWPVWAVLITGFVVRDFVQWWTHRLLHRVPFLWRFHQVHHSVKEMGFAAHLRYHWMETVVYRSLEYIPLALLGVGLYEFFLIHIITLAWGHYNHANISLSGKVTGGVLAAIISLVALVNYPFENMLTNAAVFTGAILFGVFAAGPFMKYIFNSPEMHIWHHAYHLPEGHRYGINFGITLALWDYLFGTAVIPASGKDIPLGFEGDEHFPESFGKQLVYGFGKDNEKVKEQHG